MRTNTTKNLFRITALTVALVLLAGCQTTNPYTGERQTSKATTGAALGAVGGAVLGAITSSRKNRQKGLLIGAGLGAVTGAVAGNYMDDQEKELRKTMAASGVTVTRQDDSIILNMPGNITFDFASNQLNSQFYPVLDGVVEVLKKYDSTVISVVGHTDSVGSDQVNQDLSVKRAESVANHLINRGVLAGRILIWGYGKSRPIATNSTEEGRAANRRVELTIEPITPQ